MDHFKDIRPYVDSEVSGVLSSLTSNQSVVNALIGLQFPGIFSKIPFFKFFIKQRLITRAKTIKTIDDYQKLFKKLMEKVVEESIQDFQVNGIDQLHKNDSYLFISNHRDITLDAALLALNLYQSGFKTFNIAVGNNLMEEKWASDLFRLNKSFIIQRSGATKKEIYSGLSLASKFINKSIFHDNDSIWIAQKQGRAKDGIDETDPALLKMIHLTERKSKSIADYFNSIKVVPVSISYELDPNDQLKAMELDSYESKNQYVKQKDEDLRSIANGITGFKGSVTLNISEPMRFEPSDNYQEISDKITNLIVKMYELYPTNFAACNMLGWDWQDKPSYSTKQIKQAQEILDDRTKLLSARVRSKLLEQYANPVIRKLHSY
tara:strand:+ start:2812 stop:3945 length:1134 start_codon:yes stop_codon:yes gene_type:complete